MTTTTTTIQGVINGRTIQLANDPGLTAGAQVEVVLRPTQATKAWGEGLRRCAGALADLPASVDEDLEQIVNERHSAQFRDLDE